MAMLSWVREHWFDLVQSVGIIGGLVYTGRVVRIDAKARRIQTLFALTKQHRQIWSLMHKNPGLIRVIDPKADVATKPVTPEEELFVTFVILHLSDAYQAAMAGFFVTPQGLAEDVRGFFSMPVPGDVWRRKMTLQDRDFVAFVEAALHPAKSSGS